MDRIYNNEFLASCVVLKILAEGLSDITKLSVCLVLAMDDALRQNISGRNSFESYAKQVCSKKELNFNNKYKDYLVLFVNTVVMLSQANAVYIEKNDVFLTNHGMDMLSNSIEKIPSYRLASIGEATPQLVCMLLDANVESIFNNLNVEL